MLIRTVTRPSVILTLVAVLLVALTSVFVDGVSLAQSGETINYGQTVVGNINSAAPLAVYRFNAGAGDLITVRVAGLTSEMDPSVILLGPAQEQLATSDNDQFSFGAGDARISFFTASGGAFSLIVGGARGTTGDFVLRLEGRTPVTATEIEFNVPVRVDVPINSAPQFFTFQADTAEPFCPTTLTVTAETPGFEFAVKIRDEEGELVTQLRGGRLQESRTTVQANTGEYEVEVLAADPITQGAIYLIVTCADEAPICDGLGGLSALPLGDGGTSSGDDDDDDDRITPTPFIPLGDDDDDDRCEIRLDSPLDGMAYGDQTFYWTQLAGTAPGGYRVTVVGGAGCGPGTGGTTGATSITLNLSSLGGSCFSATWSVEALGSGGETLCSAAATVPREAQGDDDDDDDDDNNDRPFCGDGICQTDENANLCPDDCL